MVWLAIQHFSIWGVQQPYVFQPTRETPKCYFKKEPYNHERRFLKRECDIVEFPCDMGRVVATGSTETEAREKARNIIRNYIGERFLSRLN